MEISDENLRYYRIFMPDVLENRLKVAQDSERFAYYTTADTALKVLQNQELWFRNAMVMNDFSEIFYGLNLIKSTFSGPVGARFKEAVNDIFEGTIEKVDGLLGAWERDWQLETYIACISLHDATEDGSGRLSMWRAYGDTAIVVKNTPMIAITDLLAVYSTPVLYLSVGQYEERLNKITNNILIERSYLRGLGQDALVSYIHHMLFQTAIATKHPGFSEEKEWRLYYRPSDQVSPAMKARTVVLKGVPQIVYALPLKHEPEHGLFGADIPSLIDRIIVGPTAFPYVSVVAFRSVLRDLMVEDVDTKVVASDIPLRTG